MNFRHPFELGLAQFSPILLFEPSRGVLQTRPEATFLLLLYKSVTHYSLVPPLKTSETLEIIGNMPSGFSVSSRVGGGSVADLFSLSSPILVSNLPSSIFQTGTTHRHIPTHTHAEKKTPTHGSLCTAYLPWLITQKRNARRKVR